MVDALTKMIMVHEGSVKKAGRHMPYICPAGKQTIGYGRNIEDRGISEDEARYLLQNDIDQSQQELSAAFSWFSPLSEPRKIALTDMCVNLGLPRLKTFKKAIAAFALGDYETAAMEMLDSKWARHDVPERARTIAHIILTNELPANAP